MTEVEQTYTRIMVNYREHNLAGSLPRITYGEIVGLAYDGKPPPSHVVVTQRHLFSDAGRIVRPGEGCNIAEDGGLFSVLGS